MIMAFVSVVFLLTPALILFLVPMARGGMAAVVLAFVFLFACALAQLSEPKAQEMLIGIAAYVMSLLLLARHEIRLTQSVTAMEQSWLPSWETQTILPPQQYVHVCHSRRAGRLDPSQAR